MDNTDDPKTKLQEAEKTMEEEWGPAKPLDDVSAFCGSGGIDLDKTDWNSLDYNQGRDIEWYRRKFPGFDDDILEILAKCDGTAQAPDDKGNFWEQRQRLKADIKSRTVNFD